MNEQNTIDLGIVGIKNMGVYDPETTYEKLNVVTYQGSSYCASKDTVGNLPTDTEYWQLYAQKGDPGETGPQGDKPVKGVDYYTENDKSEIETDLLPYISEEIASQLGNLTSATPLVATSISDMVDTTRIYVNTTDGYWYYYNGTEWVQGAIYQSTGVSDGGIDKYKLDNELKDAIFKTFETSLDLSDCVNNLEYIKSVSSSIYTEFTGTRLLVVPIKSFTTYIVKKSLGSKLRLYTSVNFPGQNVAITNTVSRDGYTDATIISGENDKYLGVYYYGNASDGGTYTPTEILNTIKVYEGEVIDTETQAHYLDSRIDAEHIIDSSRLNTELKNAIFKDLGDLIDISDCNSVEYIKDHAESVYVGFTGVKTLVVPIDPNEIYYVKKIKSARFRLYLSTDYPSAYYHVPINSYITDDNANQLSIETGDNDAYLGILYYSGTYDTLTEREILDSIEVYKNKITETQAHYLESKIDNYFINSFDNPNCLKLMSYRPLSEFDRPYIAISSDDGANSLADVTVDIFKTYKTVYNKNIPLTMALMHNSAIFGNSTKKSKVLDLINNYGSSVAIHGITSYTEYTTKELFDFLDNERDYLTNNLVAPSSIIFPNHAYNERTATIAGSYYGVSCTGGTQLGTNYLNRPRTNRYTLYRFSLFNSSMTTNIIKDAIDYCYEHNLVFMPFFHDNTLQNDYDRCKPLLDYCVEYANSKGFTFINVGDIPYLRN